MQGFGQIIQVREMWKQKQEGEHSGYLPRLQVDGQSIQQTPHTMDKKHNGGYDSATYRGYKWTNSSVMLKVLVLHKRQVGKSTAE